MAKHSKCPIMSLQDDVYHPFQGLADLMTIFEHFGRDPQGAEGHRLLGLRRIARQAAVGAADADPPLPALRPRRHRRPPARFPAEQEHRRQGQGERQGRRRQADLHRRHGRGGQGGAGGHPQELGRLRRLRGRRVPEERGRMQEGDGRPPGQAQGLDLRPPPRQAGRPRRQADARPAGRPQPRGDRRGDRRRDASPSSTTRPRTGCTRPRPSWP